MARQPQGDIRSNLKYLRLRANISLDEMAELTGVSRAELWRLENLKTENPRIRFLANCAIVLGVPLEELIEPKWREWLVIGEGGPTELAPEELKGFSFRRWGRFEQDAVEAAARRSGIAGSR